LSYTVSKLGHFLRHSVEAQDLAGILLIHVVWYGIVCLHSTHLVATRNYSTYIVT